MTERDRVNLYNDLCDYKDALAEIIVPPKTKEIALISRAISYVRGSNAKWLHMPDTKPVTKDGRALYFLPTQCSFCGFAEGRSSYKFCPECGSRITPR